MRRRLQHTAETGHWAAAVANRRPPLSSPCRRPRAPSAACCPLPPALPCPGQCCRCKAVRRCTCRAKKCRHSGHTALVLNVGGLALQQAGIKSSSADAIKHPAGGQAGAAHLASPAPAVTPPSRPLLPPPPAVAPPPFGRRCLLHRCCWRRRHRLPALRSSTAQFGMPRKTPS